MIDHRLIEIGRVDHYSLGQVSGQSAGDDPRAGGSFQKPTRTKIGEAPGDIPRVGCEDQWPQKMIVYSGNRPREHPVCFHRPSPLPENLAERLRQAEDCTFTAANVMSGLRRHRPSAVCKSRPRQD